jgi:phosphoglycerate kinase
VGEFLSHYLKNLSFVPQVTGVSVYEKVKALEPGGVLLLENLRRDAGEMNNDPAFAKTLASYADYFVQDAFDVCHRMHTSLVGVPKILPSYAGLLLEREVEHLTKALSPVSPSLVIFGGAKFATKIPALHALLPLYDRVFVGGAVLHDLLLARGYEIGKSLSSHNKDAFQEMKDNPKIVIPEDVVVVGHEGRAVRKVDEVLKDDVILDAGPRTLLTLSKDVLAAKAVLWNGPLGNYERGFDAGDKTILSALVKSRAFSIVGGGDTVASIEHMDLENKLSFVSTGGGAMLEFLAKRTLPGIAALG